MVNYDYSEEAIERFRNRLPTLRFIAGISQSDLARLLGVSRTTVTTLENDRGSMSILAYLACQYIFDNLHFDAAFDISYCRFLLIDQILDCSESAFDVFKSNVIEFRKAFGFKNGTKKQSEKFLQCIMDDNICDPFFIKYDFTEKFKEDLK